MELLAKKYSPKPKSGDAEALALYSTFGEHLGNLIIQVLYTFDPKPLSLGVQLVRHIHILKVEFN